MSETTSHQPPATSHVYTPTTVRDECLRVGTFALTTLQCALVVAVHQRKTTSQAPHYQHARRTLAAWLNEDEWHRHTFKLKGVGPWQEVYEQLNRKSVLDYRGVFTSEYYPPAPDYELTPLGRGVAALLEVIVPPPMTGDQYAKFIEAQKRKHSGRMNAK